MLPCIMIFFGGVMHVHINCSTFAASSCSGFLISAPNRCPHRAVHIASTQILFFVDSLHHVSSPCFVTMYQKKNIGAAD